MSLFLFLYFLQSKQTCLTRLLLSNRCLCANIKLTRFSLTVSYHKHSEGKNVSKIELIWINISG